MNEMTLPVEATIPSPTPDPEKDAVLRAAVFYDRVKQERDDLLLKLEQARYACDVKDNQIRTLELSAATEQNRYDALHNAYNEALQDRADLEAILTTQQAHHEDQAARLAKFEFSRLRRNKSRKRNGNGESVPDASGSEAVLADIGSVLASRSADKVLGQQTEAC